MQSLYAYYRGNQDQQQAVEINMMKGIREIENLYLIMLDLTLAVKNEAEKRIEIGLQKNFPTPEEANPNRRFVQNPIFEVLDKNPKLNEFREDHKEYNWNIEDVYPHRIFKAFTESDTYKSYMQAEQVEFKDHQKVILHLFEEYIAPNEEVASFLEDKNIHWADDLHIANSMVYNTIKSFTKHSDENTKLLKLLLDEAHLDFTRDLVRQTIRYEEELTQIIDKTATNWELERIALVDKIILQMALAEFLHFPSIPPKVSINEYVEIAKSYSTPNSKIFINGILDKALKELTEAGSIRKTARGLM